MLSLAHEEITRANEQLAGLRREKLQVENAFKDSSSKLENEVSQLTGQLKASQEALRTEQVRHSSELARLQQRVEEAEQRLRASENQRTDLRVQAGDLEKRLREMEDRHRVALDDLQESLRQSESERDRSRDSIAQMLGDHSRLGMELATVHERQGAQSQVLQNRVYQMETMLAQLTAERDGTFLSCLR